MVINDVSLQCWVLGTGKPNLTVGDSCNTNVQQSHNNPYNPTSLTDCYSGPYLTTVPPSLTLYVTGYFCKQSELKELFGDGKLALPMVKMSCHGTCNREFA